MKHLLYKSLILALAFYVNHTVWVPETIRADCFEQQTEIAWHDNGSGIIAPVPPQPQIETEALAQEYIFPTAGATQLSAYNNDIAKPLYQSPVKDQHQTDLCWSFAAMAAIEASTIKHGGGVIDLSEVHAAYALSKDSGNSIGFDRTVSGVGWTEAIVAYLMRGELMGVVKESDDRLETRTITSRTLDITKSKPASFTVPNAYTLTKPEYEHSRDAKVIKEAIEHYGAVSSYMMISDEFYWGANTAHHAYYYDGSKNSREEMHGGHMVAIVGWDDNYPRENFLLNFERPSHASHNPNTLYSISRPVENGAWLIKNSWGSDWFGLGGYAWISYEDVFIGEKAFAFDTVQPFEPGKIIYEYDPFGCCSYVASWVYGANIFTAINSNELLTEVKVYVYTSGDHVKIYCIPDYSGNLSMDMLNPIAEFDAADSYGTPYRGYYTIPIEVPVKVGNNFALVVKYQSGVIPIEQPLDNYSSQATANAGESYVFNTGGAGLTDISADNMQNICVKAVTVDTTKVTSEFGDAGPVADRTRSNRQDR